MVGDVVVLFELVDLVGLHLGGVFASDASVDGVGDATRGVRVEEVDVGLDANVRDSVFVESGRKVLRDRISRQTPGKAEKFFLTESAAKRGGRRRRCAGAVC